MPPKSKYARSPICLDNSSSSALNVTVQQKRKVVRRPAIEAAGSPSSKLDSMERTRAAISTTIEAIIDMYGERPLPPVPKVPSSIYAPSKQDTSLSRNWPVSPELPGPLVSPQSLATPSPIIPVQTLRTKLVTERDLKSPKHLSQLFKKEKGRMSGRSGALPKGGESVREAETPNVSEAKKKVVKPVPFTEWKAPTYQEPSSSSKSSPRTPVSQRSASFDSPRLSSPMRKTAGGNTVSCFAVHHARSPNFERAPYSPLFTQIASPSLLSATIKDVGKQTVVPYPLLTSSLPESPPHSHFSPSSPTASDHDSLAGAASSLRTRTKKALLQSKAPKRLRLKQRMDSSQSDLSHISPTATHPPSIHDSITQRPPRRNSVQQGISDMYDTLQSMYTPTYVRLKDSRFSRMGQLSPLKKKLPTKEMHSPAIPLTEYQKYGRKAWKEPKKQTYVYRTPRKRLSKLQMTAVSKIASPAQANSPDTTYKIEIPTPPTTKQLDDDLLFDHTYHIEISPSTISTLMPSSLAVIPTRTNVTMSRRFSHSVTGSVYGHQLSNRLSRAEKKRMQRYSLPTTTHTRQNTDDSMTSNVKQQATGSISESKEGTSSGQKLASLFPRLGLVRIETEPVLALDLESERDRGGRDRNRERAESRVRVTSGEMRREELKKRIVVMGDPSAVGLPF